MVAYDTKKLLKVLNGIWSFIKRCYLPIAVRKARKGIVNLRVWRRVARNEVLFNVATSRGVTKPLVKDRSAFPFLVNINDRRGQVLKVALRIGVCSSRAFPYEGERFRDDEMFLFKPLLNDVIGVKLIRRTPVTRFKDGGINLKVKRFRSPCDATMLSYAIQRFNLITHLGRKV